MAGGMGRLGVMLFSRSRVMEELAKRGVEAL
jgi:hypothetical protein